MVVMILAFLVHPVFAADLTVMVKGFRSAKGGVAFSVFQGKEGYPVDEKKAVVLRYVDKVEGQESAYFVQTVFKNLKTGPVAIGVFHDEDGDKVLTTNFLGIPTESTGASRDASGAMGPPSYEDAVIELNGNQSIEINL